MDETSARQVEAGQKYFQLTHDYLVRSLREWLTFKQKETRKGRAELKLFEAASTWNAKPVNRFLPPWQDFLAIRLLTEKRSWTAPQQKMMREAGRLYGIRTSLFALLVMLAAFIGTSIRRSVIDYQNLTRAEALVDSLPSTDFIQVPAVVSELNGYREWVDPILMSKVSATEAGSSERLKIALALLPVDNSQLKYLLAQLPICSLNQLPVLRTALQAHKDEVTEDLWQVATDEERTAAIRFQVFSALAEYAPNDTRWKDNAAFVAQYLTTAVPSVYVERWQDLLRPARAQLTPELVAIHADRRSNEVHRETAALVLADYLHDQPDKLLDVILVADEQSEWSLLMASLKRHGTIVRQRLLDEVHAPLPFDLELFNDEADAQLRDAFRQRQSLAGVTLVQLGFGDDVWPLLEFSHDPSLRSQLIYHLSKLGTDINLPATRLQREADPSIRRALIQCLGGMNAAMLSTTDRDRIVGQLKSLYVQDPDSGVHSSADWTLRQWGVESLPALPIGEPVLNDREKRAAIERLAAEIKGIEQRITTYEQTEFPARQVVWEQQLGSKPTTLPTLSDGLLAHYPLDEVDGSQTANTVADSLAGTYQGKAQRKSSGGVVGNAAQLSGFGEHFVCGEVFEPDRTDIFSYGCWFLVAKDVQQGAVLSKFNEVDARGFSVSVRAVDHEVICEWSHHWPDNSLVVHASVPEISDRWHHLFVTYDGSSRAAGVKVYVDGRSVPLHVEADRLSDSIRVSNPFQIGRRGRHFAVHGSIDDVRIYDRRLSEEDVYQLYAAGLPSLASVPRETRDVGQQSALYAAYRAEDETLLRMQSQLNAVETALRNARRDSIRRWYINADGRMMVVFPNPTSRESSINHSFAIASHEVTLAEFRQLRADYLAESSDDKPVIAINWYEMAEYCNWLSEREGIPEQQWAYVPNEKGQYANGMLVREDAMELKGYRLPTEEEWEHACRAGSDSTFSFGESESLLRRYAQFVENSYGHSHPVGLLLPNAAGLFDMHGNVWELTQAPIRGELMSPVRDNKKRTMRGGSFMLRPQSIRSSSRRYFGPQYRTDQNGFRIAKTYFGIP